MTALNPTPYTNLTPDRVLDAIEDLGLVPDGRLLALNSYENRVYRIGLEDGSPVVAKFYRPGRWSDEQIEEEHGFTAELVEREIPTIPPLVIGGRTLHHFEGFRFTLTPMRGGRTPELEDTQVLEWLGRSIGRIHAVGARVPYRHRPTLDIATFGEAPRTLLFAEGWIPADLDTVFRSVLDQALDGVRTRFGLAGEIRTLRLHGDCHLGNLLWNQDGPLFVDLDDTRMGPAIQDLWMLLSGDRFTMSGQLAHVLAGYEAFHPFDYRELHLIEALRTLRLIHHCAWLARRWEDPAFPIAFPWFNTQHYWQDLILQLREQIAAMEEGPLWPN
ncbi:serine/threonine protein kinase [Thioalkalicoccus limnaeus]|uniref:Stress response kinase A n=1 Tax=Thioalkalicoccus limnaeus TaxID=120681 RepID=A0ABV4BM04_9GAMM